MTMTSIAMMMMALVMMAVMMIMVRLMILLVLVVIHNNFEITTWMVMIEMIEMTEMQKAGDIAGKSVLFLPRWC